MIEEANLLCDRIERLIEDAAALIKDDSLAEKRKQLQQITVSVENLSRVNVAVPPDLISLSDTLSKELSEHDVAAVTLKTLYERLERLRHFVEPLARVRASRRKTQRRDLSGGVSKAKRPDVTPQSAWNEHILSVLRELGGSADVRVIRERLFEVMKDRLLPGDFEIRESTGDVIWWNNAQWARNRLREKGVLRSNSRRGVWELADVTKQDLEEHE